MSSMYQDALPVARPLGFLYLGGDKGIVGSSKNASSGFRGSMDMFA